MRVGIFLGYGPTTILGKEGLGRYLGGLLSGFQNKNIDITIACSRWLIKPLNDLFSGFGINGKKITFLMPERMPPLWRFYCYLSKPVKKVPIFRKVAERLVPLIKVVCNIYASMESDYVFWGFSIFLLLLCILAVIPTSFFIGITLLVKRLKKFVSSSIVLKNKKFISKINQFSDANNQIKLGEMMRLAFEEMNESEQRRIVKRINSSDQFDVWFVPSLFWPEVNRIENGIVVINAPDLVTESFALGFSNIITSTKSMNNCRLTLTEGNYFVTYCDYVKESLLVSEYSKPRAQVVSIPHMNNDMSEYLAIDNELKKHMGIDIDLSQRYALSILEGTKRYSSSYDYLKKYKFESAKYIFYPSQYRPNKNMLNLIKAYEYLLREKFIHHKLFITANVASSAELQDYINDHNLSNEVISFYNVPEKSLAALYKCADLVVNPTLYEGGFPFTFGEGMSVGTPSIMSDIPQVRSVLKDSELEDQILFDPFDWMDMAECIDNGIRNKKAIYAAELPLYRQLEERTNDVVALEYLEAFRYFVDYSKGESIQ